jgi:5-methylthioadenosine/S-adenosylhomocysteine deaminase
MPLVPADLLIEPRWMAPMTARNMVLEHHSLVVRDGRILDILPSALAHERYAATAVLQRAAHLLMPGMINTASDAATLLHRAERAPVAEAARDGVLLSIAQMLKSGITCFADRGYFPEVTARAANEQAVRAVVGMPVTESATPWADNAAQSLTRALNLRDLYRDDPLVSTVFAPRAANNLSDETFSRLATLADELEAGILIDLHQATAEIEECLAQYKLRPIERLWKLGLLTPAMNAVHMVHLTAADIGLARRAGISVTLCPQADLKLGHGLPPATLLAQAELRLGLGSAGGAFMNQDVWGDLKLVALMSHTSRADAQALSPWDVLKLATCSGAAVLGLEADIGSLETGKWADLCCVDLSGPNTHPVGDPLRQLVFAGGRDIVSDVWVAGRQLLSGAELTRLDWPDVAARSQAWSAQIEARSH